MVKDIDCIGPMMAGGSMGEAAKLQNDLPVASAKDSDAPHYFPKAKGSVSGYGHPVTLQKGATRLSGHSGAHRLGMKKK